MKKLIVVAIVCSWMSIPVYAQVPSLSTDIEGTIWLFTSDNTYYYEDMWLAFSSGSIYRVHGNSEGEFRICNEMDYVSYYNIGRIAFYNYTEIMIGDWVRTGKGGAKFAGLLFPMLGMGFEWRVIGPNIILTPKFWQLYSPLENEEIQQWVPEEECDELHGPFN